MNCNIVPGNWHVPSTPAEEYQTMAQTKFKPRRMGDGGWRLNATQLRNIGKVFNKVLTLAFEKLKNTEEKETEPENSC